MDAACLQDIILQYLARAWYPRRRDHAAELNVKSRSMMEPSLIVIRRRSRRHDADGLEVRLHSGLIIPGSWPR